MAKAIIFGVGGQTGHYLAQLLRDGGLTVIGAGRKTGEVRLDVADFSAVRALVEDHRPDFLFHLAANSTTRHDALFENHATIAGGTLHVLEAARMYVPEARVFITGSGVQFMNRGLPIHEATPFDPVSPYAVSRIASVYAARYYRSLKIRTYVGYLFHHESPLRSPRHVSQMVASGVAAIAAGTQKVIEIGDLAVAKEWTFAGDTAAAIYALVNQDTVHEAVIGSGIGLTIEEWVAACFACIGRDWRSYVRAIPGFRAEYPRLVSDPQRLRELGWRPRVSFEQLAEMMVLEAAKPR